MRLYFSLLFICALAIGGCTSHAQDKTRRPVSADHPFSVVATTSMIADLVSVIGAPYVDVEALMGPGVDPHLYKASEGDVTLMSEADIVFYNGLHLEGKMVDVFEQMSHRGKRVYPLADAVEVADLLESDYFAANYDPHIWFDIQLWKSSAAFIADILSREDSTHATHYRSSLQSYVGELNALHTWVRDQMDLIPDSVKVLVTSHDAFGYFGRAYGMEVKGLQGLSTATEAGTRDVREMAIFVAEHEIPAMFVESSISPRGIEAVREAVRDRGFDVRIGGTLYGDALGSPDSEAGHYLGMFRENVKTIVNGLGHGIRH